MHGPRPGPAGASAKTIGRPTNTARAPSAMALSTSVPRRMPPSTSSGSAAPLTPASASAMRGSAHARQRGVEGAATVVGDDQRIGAQRMRELRVLGMQHALEHERQRGLRAQPGDVVPARRRGQQATAEFAATRRRRRSGRFTAATSGGRRSRRAALAVTCAVHRRIHRQHQRFVAGGFRAAHEFEVEAALALQVELEPQRPRRLDRTSRATCSSGTLACALEHHAGALRGGCQRDAEIRRSRARGAGRYRRDQDRVRERAPSSSTRVCPARAAQHARLQPVGGPGRAVGSERDLVGRAAGEVGQALASSVSCAHAPRSRPAKRARRRRSCLGPGAAGCGMCR